MKKLFKSLYEACLGRVWEDSQVLAFDIDKRVDLALAFQAKVSHYNRELAKRGVSFKERLNFLICVDDRPANIYATI